MFCRNCGKEVAEQAVMCVSCGCPPAAGKTFCQYCGAGRIAAGVKSRVAAGLLGIFLGWLGVHRFYLGYTGIGIVQIIVTFCTLGIGGLWGFIEGILILTGSFNEDAKGCPLRD